MSCNMNYVGTISSVLEPYTHVDHRLVPERVALLEDTGELCPARVRADLVTEVTDRVNQRRNGRLSVTARCTDGKTELVAAVDDAKHLQDVRKIHRNLLDEQRLRCLRRC